MVRYTLILFFIGLAFWGCGEADGDTTPSTIEILTPSDGDKVFDFIKIRVDAVVNYSSESGGTTLTFN